MTWGSFLWTCVYYKKLSRTVSSHYTSLSAPHSCCSLVGPQESNGGFYMLWRPSVAFTHSRCVTTPCSFSLASGLLLRGGWSGQKNKRILIHSFKNMDQAINWHTAPSVISTPNSLDPVQIDGIFIQLQTLIKHVLRRQAGFWTQNDQIHILTLPLLGNKHWQLPLPQSFPISPTIKWEQ